MSDNWTKDHAAGKHQNEVVSIMRAMEPALHGHSRAIILIALMRTIAAMLGPARVKTRADFLAEMPITIGKILAEMDLKMEELQREARSASKQ